MATLCEDMLDHSSDFIRTYTWDKRLETILKESTFGKGEPTIITPKQYKARFRNAMERYFLLVGLYLQLWH